MADHVSAMDCEPTNPPTSPDQHSTPSATSEDIPMPDSLPQLSQTPRREREEDEQNETLPLAKRICRDVAGKIMGAYETLKRATWTAKDTIQTAASSAITVPTHIIVRRIRANQRHRPRRVRRSTSLSDSPWNRAVAKRPIKVETVEEEAEQITEPVQKPSPVETVCTGKRKRSESPEPKPEAVLESTKRVRLSPKVISFNTLSRTPARSVLRRGIQLSTRKIIAIQPDTPSLLIPSTPIPIPMPASSLQTGKIEDPPLEPPANNTSVSPPRLGSPWPVLFPTGNENMQVVTKVDHDSDEESQTDENKENLGVAVPQEDTAQSAVPQSEHPTSTNTKAEVVREQHRRTSGVSAHTIASVNGSPLAHKYLNGSARMSWVDMGEDSLSDAKDMDKIVFTPARKRTSIGQRDLTPMSLRKNLNSARSKTTPNRSFAETEISSACDLTAGAFDPSEVERELQKQYADKANSAINATPGAFPNEKLPSSIRNIHNRSPAKSEMTEISSACDVSPGTYGFIRDPVSAVDNTPGAFPKEKPASSAARVVNRSPAKSEMTEISSACDVSPGTYGFLQDPALVIDNTPGAFPKEKVVSSAGRATHNKSPAKSEMTEISSSCNVSPGTYGFIQVPVENTSDQVTPHRNPKSTLDPFVSPESPYSFEVHDCTVPLYSESKFLELIEEAKERDTVKNGLSSPTGTANQPAKNIVDDSPPSSPTAAEPKTPSSNKVSPSQFPATQLEKLSITEDTQFQYGRITPKAGHHSAEKTQRLTRAEKKKLEAQKDAFNYEIKPLSSDWDSKIKAALTKGHGSYAASDLVRVVPLSSTRGTDNWLNDEVINGYLTMVVEHGKKNDRPTQKVPSYHTFNSFFYSNLSSKGYDGVKRWATRAKIGGKNLLETEKIFIPINSGLHWTLAVISGKSKKVTHYNSLGGNGRTYVDTLQKWLAGELGAAFKPEEWKFEYSGESPRQQNMDDCGVFTITSARQIMLGLTPMSYTPGQIPTQRRRIVAELINGGLIRSKPAVEA